MASKEKVEKCVAPQKDIKIEAKIDSFEKSDSTPKKENVEIVGCTKSMKKIDDVVAGVESTPPTGVKQEEKFTPIEGSACSKVKLADVGENFSSMELTPPVVSTIRQLDSIVQRSANISSNVAVPRRAGAICRELPNFEAPPLVLATHLVPSLPISLFEIVAEMIETVTGQPVVLLHESRSERSVAKNIVDIAFLPVGDDWEEGSLLPVSFVFEHRLNTTKNPDVYVDVVVARDCSRNIEGIIDLRGYRCAVPDRGKAGGAAALLFKHLSLKGENPSFFGNTLDSGSQLAALQMVAGKQTEIGVLESPVIRCHKNSLPGIESVCVLETLGPLPPYRIMLNNKIQSSMRKIIMESLLSSACDDAWTERLGEFGVLGFAEYNVDRYDREDLKSVVTSVPYY